MYPKTIELLIAMLLLQKANLPTYQTQVGATADDLTEVEQDLANLQYLDTYSDLIDAAKVAITSIKYDVFNGDENEAVSPFPDLPKAIPPFPPVAGCYQRALKRNRRFKAADDYTKEIGIALGIEEATKPKPSPDSVKPTLEVHAASSGYEFAVVIGKRGESTMWKIFGRRSGTEKRQELASGTGKSGNVEVQPTVDGQPEKLEITVQLYKDNKPYGQPSDAVYVTVSP